MADRLFLNMRTVYELSGCVLTRPRIAYILKLHTKIEMEETRMRKTVFVLLILLVLLSVSCFAVSEEDIVKKGYFGSLNYTITPMPDNPYLCKLTIQLGSGTKNGKMKDYEMPWDAYAKRIAEVEIQEGVTHIGINAFYGFDLMTKITLPSTIQSIGEHAFDKCSSLKSIDLPRNLRTMGIYAFSGCTSLEAVIIPEYVKELPASVFEGCENLASVTLPEGLKSIGVSAFNGCKSLKNIYIPDSVTYFGICAFSNCSFETFSFPAGISVITHHAFSSCSYLKSIIFPGVIACVEEGCFHACTSLESITIEEGVVSIGKGAFRNCSNLKKVNIPGSMIKIDEKAFMACSSLDFIYIPDSVTMIAEDAFPVLTNVVCHEGSYAQNWAEKMSIEYTIIDGDFTDELFDKLQYHEIAIGTVERGATIYKDKSLNDRAGSISRNSNFYILKELDDVYLVVLEDGKKGYIGKDTCIIERWLVDADDIPESVENDESQKAIVSVLQGSNIRSGASSSYDKIGYADKGDTFKFLGEENGWYKVELSTGKVGYISKERCELIEN